MTTPGKSQAPRDTQKTGTSQIEEEGQEREAMSNPNIDETGTAEDDFSELLDEDVVEDEDEETERVSR